MKDLVGKFSFRDIQHVRGGVLVSASVLVPPQMKSEIINPCAVNQRGFAAGTVTPSDCDDAISSEKLNF